MSGCCEGKCDALALLRQRQSRALKVVLGINAGMFVLEVVAGLMAHSSSVLADSLDMLGDAVVYSTSLYVIGRGERWQARMAFVKGCVMIGLGFVVVLDVVAKVIGDRGPSAEGMGAIGLLALVANATCLYVLTRHRDDDINMRSVWVCSRNDIVANCGVLLAAGGVAFTGSRWPDVMVGAAIAVIVLTSAFRVTRTALGLLKERPLTA